MTLALITGGSGLVGSNLTRALLDDGYKVRCLDFDKDHRAFEGLDVELVDGDITKENTLEKAFSGVDIVFHTAALINLDRRYRDLIRLVNVEGTRNVCEAALNSSVKKMIHFSSVDAFYRFPIEEPLYEDRKLIDDPNAMPYDLSKADGNRVVLDYCSKGLDASIIHPTSIVGPNDNVIIPNGSKKLDHEVEIAFIVGKKAKRVLQKDAQDYIIGYCICNDISEREWQIEKMGQWVKGKSHDTFGPIGPYLVTPNEIKDVNNLNLSLDVNEKRMQTGNTNKMIFNVYHIVAYLSKYMSLQAGDIITTGTPPGVGMGKKPQVFLKNGDTMRLSIDNLGEQNSKVK